jgi:hypothetical protein
MKFIFQVHLRPGHTIDEYAETTIAKRDLPLFQKTKLPRTALPWTALPWRKMPTMALLRTGGSRDAPFQFGPLIRQT